MSLFKEIRVILYRDGSWISCNVMFGRNRHGNYQLFEPLQRYVGVFDEEVISGLIHHRVVIDPASYKIISHPGCKRFKFSVADNRHEFD